MTKVDNVTDLFTTPHNPDEERTDLAYLKEFEDEAMEYLKNEGKYSGISTGYPYMDFLLGSFEPGSCSP
jgi:hypothetical protein